MPVEVSVPDDVRFGPVAGLRVRRTVLPPVDVVQVRRRPCTSGARTAIDIARGEPLGEAVAALDVLLARGVVDRAALRRSLETSPSSRGARRARRAVELADPRAESPQESRVRVLLALAGLAAVPQYTVRDDDGGFVARVDLAFPEHRLAVEYDGAWHGEPGQLRRDRRRLNGLTAAGWRVVFVTAADLRAPEAVVARVVEALAR
ncbi:endonuclease domain-containing protein [Geodermatophilus sp. SYSU D01036]